MPLCRCAAAAYATSGHRYEGNLFYCEALLRAMRDALRNLQAALSEETVFSRFRVVCLPDFFLDHFVSLPPWAEANERMRGIHDRGGGNYPTGPQPLLPGGNAANTAIALARLGVPSSLVTRTSAFGKAFIEQTLGKAGVDVTHVRDGGDLAVTTILEYGPEHRNVMLNYPGSVLRFGFNDLTDDDQRLISESDLVLVANWTLNREKGTELAADTFRFAKKHGVKTVLDTGDPSSRLGDVPALLDRVCASRDLDVLGVNENELAFYAPEGGPDVLARGRALKARVAGTVDLHTGGFCASWTGPAAPAVVPTFRVDQKRATGAGDAWNAGNITGHLLGLPPTERLLLANAVAGLYISSPDGVHPSREQVVKFLQSQPVMKEIPA